VKDAYLQFMTVKGYFLCLRAEMTLTCYQKYDINAALTKEIITYVNRTIANTN